MAPTNRVTQREQFFLSDALELENLCISKCSIYAEQCQDNEIKSLMWNITKNKRRHADQVKQLLSQTGGSSLNQYQ